MVADAASTVMWFEHGHVHTVRCYWDCRQARWQCATAAPEEARAAEPAVIAFEGPQLTVPAESGYERTAVTT